MSVSREVDEVGTELTKLREDHRTMVAALAELRGTLDEAVCEGERRQSDLESLRHQLESSRNELMAAHERIAHLEAAVRTIESSRAWRVVEAYRALRRWSWPKFPSGRPTE